MNVCILAVCYNSYSESLVYIDSVHRAMLAADVDLNFVLIDNSCVEENSLLIAVKELCTQSGFKYYKSANLGYIPSISAAIAKLSINLAAYDYVCVSNVDVSLADNFFEVLQQFTKKENIGAIAPAIVSKSLGLDRNPKIVKRPSRIKLKINQLLFSSGFSYWLLKNVNKQRLRISRRLQTRKRGIGQNPESGKNIIYAPHGSFMILTEAFTQHDNFLSYPVFLFGEELYIGEKARKLGLSIVYYPELLVEDMEHASTSVMPSRAYRSENIKALSYILERY